MSGNSVLEFAAASSINVDLATDAVAKLILDDTLHFNGSVTGFDANDQLDLTNVAFANGGSLSFTANESNTGGMLSVSDGLQSASILFDGQYDPSGSPGCDRCQRRHCGYLLIPPTGVATASASAEPITTATSASSPTEPIASSPTDPTAAVSTGPSLTVTAASTGSSVMDTSSVATTASTSAQPVTATTASVATDLTVATSTDSSLTVTPSRQQVPTIIARLPIPVLVQTVLWRAPISIVPWR